MTAYGAFDRRRFLTAAGTAGIGLVAGCSGGDGATAGDASGGDEEPISIGSIQPLSGNFSVWSRVHASGLAFAIDEINRDGGVLDGRELRVVEGDSGSDPAEAAALFERFVEQDGIVAATGPVSSDVGIRTSRTAQELGVPMFTHMAGSSDTITPDTRHTFRVGLLPAEPTMRAQAALAEARGYNSVSAIVADYAWGRSVQSAIEEVFTVDVDIQVAPVSQSDFSTYVRQIPDEVRMVVTSGHPPGVLTITQQLYELGRDPDVVTGSSWPPDVVRSTLGAESDRGFTHVHLADPYSDEFAEVAERYARAVDGQFNTHTAYGYVTGKLIAQAIENAGEADPEAITEATRAIEFDTLFANPIQYADSGELENQIQLYSTVTADPPSYYPEGDYGYTEVFRTDPLPAIPAEA
ncbi:ABC transporter substrate-binding protein [Halobellus ruber]|uniref:ABC transporter substrate-binding protein n=1 Tax=Halobellus ruber TaxID=2761102 RepID=A0A7J9SJH8_9EURY|nr:ABC transporter substrate-binding protein [Halobellus ruber]MBB6646692.1 ABC transporter substrate-binding protein [Halobellus ruber]